MTYQALARKWRPQDFSSLIGQEPVVTALRNALLDGRIAHAYLFSGIRGVGKTTAARVLAKALNCERGPAADPCSDCLPCREIAAGADLDVLEIDAATYSKVEQVRELTESLRYGPARDRYKVVVLDEVHRLSRQAFDALLKIVEEPPAHLVFVFATTEIEAVPATILSRCQEYHFRRVPVARLAAHLRVLCTAEGITASDAALHLIARAAEGSVRDAVALLDQLATYGSGAVDDEAAAGLLGTFDLDLFHRLLAGILGGDGAGLSAVVAALEGEGRDPRQLYSRLLAFCREALHLALGQQVPELPADEAARLAATAGAAGYENLLRLLHHLLASEPLVRRSEHPALALEVALLRAAELPRLTRIEELLSGEAPVAGTGAAEPSPHRSAAGPPAATAAARAMPDRPAAPSPMAGPPPAPAPGGGRTEAVSPGDTSPPEAGVRPHEGPHADSGAPFERLLQAIRRRRQLLAAHLEGAEQLRFEGGELLVVCPPADDWLEKALQRPSNTRALDEAVREVFGTEARWRPVRGGPGDAPAAAPAPPLRDPPRDPTVQAVLEIFDGTIEAVGPPATPEEER